MLPNADWIVQNSNEELLAAIAARKASIKAIEAKIAALKPHITPTHRTAPMNDGEYEIWLLRKEKANLKMQMVAGERELAMQVEALV